MSLPEDRVGGSILLADDSPLDRHLLTQLLQRRGYTVHAAADAGQALAAIRSINPDLILLDIRMPGMNGYELCARLKADPATRDIPVIFISAASAVEERVKAFASGAVDYISKPIQSEEVNARIATHLTLRALRQDLEQRVRVRTAELEAANIRLSQEIAERRSAEKTLQERDALIRCLVDANIIGIMFWRRDGTVIDANAAFLQIVGLQREDVLAGRVNWDLVVAPEDRQSIIHARAELAHGLSSAPKEKHCLRPDGTRIPILVGSARLEGVEELGISFVLDLSEPKRMERELLESRQQLRDLAAHGETAMEQERKRIAREIHDEQGSLLTALKMDLTLLRRELGETPAGVHQRLETMQHLVEEAVRVMRQVATQLRPAVLNLGILPALEWLTEDFRQRTGIACSLEAGDEIPLDDSRATALFRSVQESLTNITRHAQASQVDIRLSLGDRQAELRIADNGQGFDPSRVGSQSFGLLGMGERLEALGGTLRIKSKPGKGTTLYIAIPLEEDAL